jgi:hypothetical protein
MLHPIFIEEGKRHLGDPLAPLKLLPYPALHCTVLHKACK